MKAGIFNQYGRRKISGFTILIGLVMIGGLVAGLKLSQQIQTNRSKATNNGPTLSMIPATKTLTVGQTTSFAVTLDTNDDNVTIAKLEIFYDTTALDQVTFTPGTILPIVVVPVTVSGGRVKTSIGAQPTSPYHGTGIVGTLNVRAKSAKTSTITFTTETKVYAVGKTGSALASSEGAQITATTTGGGSPTPTRTPTPTPPSGSFSDLNCSSTCAVAGRNPLVVKGCIDLCKEIKAGTKQCPSACNTVPSNFKKICLTTLCKGY